MLGLRMQVIRESDIRIWRVQRTLRAYLVQSEVRLPGPFRS